MRISSVVAVCLCAALAAGCASRRKEAAIVVIQSDVEYERLYAAALEVVGARFSITKAQKGSGVLETDYLVGPLSQTGFKINATRADALEQSVRTIRRRAFVDVSATSEMPIAVRVEKQVLIRDQAYALPSGTFSGRDRFETIEGARTRWVEQGRDEALEKIITAEIVKRYRAPLS